MSHPESLDILLVEDSDADAQYVRELNREIDWSRAPVHATTADLTHVSRLDEAQNALTDGRHDVVLLDLRLPDATELEALDGVRETDPGVPVVVLSGMKDEETGLEAVERGASDYILKEELTPYLLHRAVIYAIQRRTQRRKLQRRNEELALLHRIISHDIRDDMSLVLGWGESVVEAVDADVRPEVRRMLDASRHVLNLTETADDLVNLLSNDAAEATLSTFDLGRTIETELRKAREEFPDAEFVVDGDLPFGMSVRATELLGSVFRNLFANAVQHNDADTPRVVVAAEWTDETVTTRVADNGPGIPTSQKRTLFETEGTSLADHDTGLGLYLVNRLVTLYDGSISVRDATPSGTVFTVELPRAE